MKIKTTEFIEKVQALGYRVNDNGLTVDVIDSNDNTLTMISSVTPFTLNSVFSKPVDDERLYDLIVNYAGTPLDCRKPEKPHAVKLIDSRVGRLWIRANHGDIYLFLKNGCQAFPEYSTKPVWMNEVELNDLIETIKVYMPYTTYELIDEPEPQGGVVGVTDTD